MNLFIKNLPKGRRLERVPSQSIEAWYNSCYENDFLRPAHAA